MKWRYWTLTLGRFEANYGYRRRPRPTVKRPFCVLVSRTEDSVSRSFYAFGKRVFFWRTDR
jgi:hypothetical protein